MINNKDKIDSYFKDSLGDYEVAPSGNLWKNISLIFFGARSGRQALYWGLLAGGLVIAVMTGTFLLVSPGADEAAKLSSDAVSQDALSPSETTPAEVTPVALSPSDAAMTVPEPGLASATMTAPEPSLAATAPLAKEPGEEAYFMTALAWNEGALPAATKQEPVIASRDKEDAPEFDFSLVDDYARRANLGFGIHFSPGVIIYDPNPNKNSYTLDATAHYKISKVMIEAGIGVNKTQDAGNYNVLYNTYDSVGYFNEVNSFNFAQDNADSIIYQYKSTTVFDSVPHIQITQKNNSYTYFTVPVSFGYRLFNKNRILSYARVGAIYTLLVDKHEPTVELNDSDASLVTIVKTVPARTQSNMMFTASISFGFMISDKVILSLEPYYWQYLNNVYEPMEGYSPKKPYVIGIRAGIDFNF